MVNKNKWPFATIPTKQKKKKQKKMPYQAGLAYGQNRYYIRPNPQNILP